MTTEQPFSGDGNKAGRRHEKAPYVITQEMIDDFSMNHLGMYTLRYRKNKEKRGTIIKDIQKKFAECGEVTQVDADEGNIYLRFAVKDHAVAVLKKFGEELKMKIMADRSKGLSDQIVEVYVGNLSPTVSQEELEEMLEKFAPYKLKLNPISNDPGKRFRSAFVKFSTNDKDKAEELIKEKNGKVWKGKKLYVGFAGSGRKGAQTYSREEGEEQKALAKAMKSQESATMGMHKPSVRSSSHDAKDFSGIIPKMLPSRKEPVADIECPKEQINKPWWKKNMPS